MENQNKNAPPAADPKAPSPSDPTVTPTTSDVKSSAEKAKTAPAAASADK